jgi:hypothetical protein
MKCLCCLFLNVRLIDIESRTILSNIHFTFNLTSSTGMLQTQFNTTYIPHGARRYVRKNKVRKFCINDKKNPKIPAPPLLLPGDGLGKGRGVIRGADVRRTGSL